MVVGVEYDAIYHRYDCRGNASIARSTSDIHKGQAMGNTHKIAVPKIPRMDKRCCREIRNFNTIGIGRINM